MFKANLLMISNILKDTVQCAHPKGFMPGNREIMGFSGNDGREALMAASLMIDTISKPRGKLTGKFVAINISWQFHTAISSSFT